MEEPFLEHPTGQYTTALQAMEDAIRRLRAMPDRRRPIMFCAQGAGASDDTIHLAEVHVLGDNLDAGQSIDCDRIATLAKVSPQCLVQEAATYSIAGAKPEEAARIMDALFRHQLGIRPFPDEADDYAVGAEWV